MLETDVPIHLHAKLCRMLGQMRESARCLTYIDLRKIWPGFAFPYRQLESNKNICDRFPTSWSVQRGHHFHLWIKVSIPLVVPLACSVLIYILTTGIQGPTK